MKKLATFIISIAAVCLVSCAGLTFTSTGKTPRTAASLATIGYLESLDKEERPAAVLRLREAAAKMQFIALAPNVSEKAVALALNEIQTEPRWQALIATLLDLYEPQLTPDADAVFRAGMVDISEGIYVAIIPYEAPAK